MKIRLYIVTYRRDDVLNENLRSLWSGTRHPEWLEVTVISNHPEVNVKPENLRPNLRVLINHTRHANSWGYLARDWNFGIIDAFKTWENNECIDWCVLAQNDVVWLSGWDDWLTQQTQFDLISQPVGDAVLALNSVAVKRVGLFDERFSTLHFHDIDYLNRAAVALGKRASINDTHFGGQASVNAVGNVLIHTSSTGFVDDDSNLHTRKSWLEMRNLFFSKWGIRTLEESVNRPELVRRLRPENLPKECLFYPFFWEASAGVLQAHLVDYSRKESVGGKLQSKFLAAYDALVALPILWRLRCLLISWLRTDDGWDRRRTAIMEKKHVSSFR